MNTEPPFPNCETATRSNAFFLYHISIFNWDLLRFRSGLVLLYTPHWPFFFFFFFWGLHINDLFHQPFQIILCMSKHLYQKYVITHDRCASRWDSKLIAYSSIHPPSFVLSLYIDSLSFCLGLTTFIFWSIKYDDLIDLMNNGTEFGSLTLKMVGGGGILRIEFGTSRT